MLDERSFLKTLSIRFAADFDSGSNLNGRSF